MRKLPICSAREVVHVALVLTFLALLCGVIWQLADPHLLSGPPRIHY